MYRGNEKLAENISTDFFKNLSWTDKVLIEVPKATHGEFSDEAYLYSKLNYPWKHTRYNSLNEAITCYQSVIHSTEAFLNLLFTSNLAGKKLQKEMEKKADKFHLKYID